MPAITHADRTRLQIYLRRALHSPGVMVDPALGGVDLTSPAGKMIMGVINSMAQFERDLLIERTQSGLKRAKAGGAVFGRPAALGADQRDAVLAGLAEGTSVAELARRHGTSRQTIMRVRDAGAGSTAR